MTKDSDYNKLIELFYYNIDLRNSVSKYKNRFCRS